MIHIVGVPHKAPAAVWSVQSWAELVQDADHLALQRGASVATPREALQELAAYYMRLAVFPSAGAAYDALEHGHPVFEGRQGGPARDQLQAALRRFEF